ncbi:Uncharacterised protein [Vibrio cholerae]|nr:Uncharacterised protein [Vibrio cholerae]
MRKVISASDDCEMRRTSTVSLLEDFLIMFGS